MTLPPGAARSSGEKPEVIEITGRFLRISEVADFLGVSKSYVRAMIKEGVLPARRLCLPGRPTERSPLLIHREDLNEMLLRTPLVKPAGDAK